MRSGFISILGKPNVGKSTLLNRIIGSKLAAVSKKPQTTRQVIRGILTEPRGQLVFLDTPGLHEPKDRLGKFMVREATNTFLDAELFYWLVDPLVPDASDFEFLRELGRHCEEAGRPTKFASIRRNPSGRISPISGGQSDTKCHPRPPASEAGASGDPASLDSRLRGNDNRPLTRNDEKPVFCLINKIDSVQKPALLPVIDAYQKKFPFREVIPISALKGDQIDLLLEKTFANLPEHAPYFPPDIASDQTERFIAGEMIREKIFRFTGEEIPYATVVQIEEFKEEGALIRIQAVVFTEKESQKAILIGAKGQKMKQIGKAAREDLERLLGKKVFLELWVKTLKNWKKDERELRRLGFQ